MPFSNSGEPYFLKQSLDDNNSTTTHLYTFQVASVDKHNALVIPHTVSPPVSLGLLLYFPPNPNVCVKTFSKKKSL